jgi:hypothetical protein
LRAFAPKKEEEADLAHRQVAGGDRWDLERDPAEETEQVHRGGGELVVGRSDASRRGQGPRLGRSAALARPLGQRDRRFIHTRIVRDDVK